MNEAAKLEQADTDILNNLDNAEKIQYSQAISLKRIADALEKLLVVPTVPKLTPEQEEEWQKANRNAGFAMYKWKD
jgi:hypothetical protein